MTEEDINIEYMERNTVAQVAPVPSRSCGSVFMLFSKPRVKPVMKGRAGLAPYDENEPDKKPVDKKKVNKMKRLFGF
jgi:hypothetical protein